MEKRLTTTAMLLTVGFVFMLVCTVGAFFYGIQIGSAKTEDKYAARKEDTTTDNDPSNPYQQQDLVSFYHTVFLPYREFQNEWFAAMDKLSQGKMNEATSMFKNLSNLAEQKSKEARSVDMQKSPLLGKAQVNYIRSLNQFKEAASKAAASAKTLTQNELATIIKQENSYLSASQNALSAQHLYYSAMLKWAATVDLDIPGDYKTPTALKLEQWKKLPIIVKNKIIAEALMNHKELSAFHPQDLTSRVDDFIQSGNSAKMKLNTLSQVVDLLISTEAVRTGDFTNNKARLYQQEMLPQLPFFYPDTNK